jgi:hypothetical protein
MTNNSQHENGNSVPIHSNAKEYWEGIEAAQKNDREERRKAELETDPKRRRKIRINGVIMSVIFGFLLLCSLAYVVGAPERIREFTTDIPATGLFPNLYKVDLDSSPLLSVIALFSLVGVVSGISRVIRGQRGPGWLPMTVIVGFFIAFAFSMYLTNEYKEPIVKELHVTQHDWAEQRYGITYDEITVGERGSRRNITYFQDKVIKDGEPIAWVCEQKEDTVAFCGVNSMHELPVIVEN